MASNTYPLTRIIIDAHIGLTNYMESIFCFINPDTSCYTELNSKGGDIQRYKASFKVRKGLEDYIEYVDQIVIWNSPYITANIAKEAIINLGIERNGFSMTKIS